MNKWDLDACIHCGKCTRSCLFLEKYGIDLPVLKEKPELAYHCFLCGTCGCVCPKGIDGKEIALDSRRKLVEDGGGKLLDNSYDGLLLEKNRTNLQITAIQKRKQFFLRDVIFRLFFRKRQISWWKNSQNMMWELYMTVVGNRLKNWDLFQRQRGSLSESTGN